MDEKTFGRQLVQWSPSWLGNDLLIIFGRQAGPSCWRFLQHLLGVSGRALPLPCQLDQVHNFYCHWKIGVARTSHQAEMMKESCSTTSACYKNAIMKGLWSREGQSNRLQVWLKSARLTMALYSSLRPQWSNSYYHWPISLQGVAIPSLQPLFRLLWVTSFFNVFVVFVAELRFYRIGNALLSTLLSILLTVCDSKGSWETSWTAGMDY